MPDFSFTGLDRKTHRLPEYRGKYVLLDFWATWCGPCRRELRAIQEAYEEFRPRGLVVLGMAEDRDVDAIRKVLTEAGVTYAQSVGDTGYDLVDKRFRVNAFPTMALLDPTGKIIAMGEGLRGAGLESTLSRALPPAPQR